MRKILILMLAAVVIDANAQTKLLGKYSFEKGGYAIVSLLSESDPNDLQKQLGEFYVDDINTLNDFKKAWTFTKESPMYSCGYHYSFYVTYNGTILESFAINLNCNVIATDKGYFYFDTKKLSQFKGRLKKPIEKQHSFQSISEGKNYIATIQKDKALLLTYDPVWTKFEGRFSFAYKNPDKKDDNDIVEKRLRTQINKLYPNENFTLNEIMWGSGGEYEFEITCNKSLFDKFTIYSKKKSWEAFKPTLTTYWK